jgi:protein-tyrosine phosphatase
MIDLHSHILHGIDDGAVDMDMSVAMAKLAVADGTRVLACTSHFMPGVYDNTIDILNHAVAELTDVLAEQQIPLKLVVGGDLHIAAELEAQLNRQAVPTIANSRYFLFEPPHHVAPPNLAKYCERLLGAGFIPILTHPERLTWIENHYDLICELDEIGVPLQLTAKSVTGAFGKRPKYWSDRMLEEGRVDFIASDAHNISSRPPGLSKAYECVEKRLGSEAACKMVDTNPSLVLQDKPLVAKSPRTKTTIRQNKGKKFWSFLNKSN